MKLFLLFLLSLLPVYTQAALPPRHDFSGQYRPNCPQADTRREADSLRLYVRFPAGTLVAGTPLYVAAWASYDAKQPLWQDSVRRVAQRLRQRPEGTWLEVTLPVARLQANQIVSVQPAPTPSPDASGEAWLLLTPNRLLRPYVLVDSLGDPLLRRYVRTSETFRVSYYGLEHPFKIKQYDAAFAAALPPMTNPAAQPAQPRTLTIRDTVNVRPGQLVRLAGQGIYAVQDDAQTPALGLLAENNAYPEITTAPELIEPLIYLTTSTERKQLYAAADPKRATDLFWLTIAGNNQNAARQMIRTYYGRVAEANRLFSAHKAGWMTDRGMLYLVLGPPDAVYRTGTEERWMYHAPAIGSGTYVFRAKPSTFAPDNYDLVRRPEYEMLWYAAVDQWRKGLTAQAAR
ncbi:GWxTD domain-containing protein [Hymenobacter aerilatus]|uniref:GWxTD domain-containing protein n=1 Tax=Hymenobacter aerilatus TaxID=2932251 RepID=A0A8T9T078_9BACT|nr:GWxTD domain-containing protein [Hymenobacter aerilatus]UOR05506.1 GWxTD domain-containing protein [Hymenobacter aerilatus]